MILIETSAWVEFDRATGSAVDNTLTDFIRARADISVTEPVLMEVLAGAKDPEAWLSLRRLLTSFEWTPVESVVDFEAATEIYRECRAQGVTPRGLIDCMVAAIAMRTNASVLTADRDFARIATAVPLSVLG